MVGVETRVTHTTSTQHTRVRAPRETKQLGFLLNQSNLDLHKALVPVEYG